MDRLAAGAFFAVFLCSCGRATPPPEADLEEAARAIQESLWARGYASCRVERRGDRLVVDPGPRVKLGRLRIEGERWQREKKD